MLRTARSFRSSRAYRILPDHVDVGFPSKAWWSVVTMVLCWRNVSSVECLSAWHRVGSLCSAVKCSMVEGVSSPSGPDGTQLHRDDTRRDMRYHGSNSGVFPSSTRAHSPHGPFVQLANTAAPQHGRTTVSLRRFASRSPLHSSAATAPRSSLPWKPYAKTMFLFLPSHRTSVNAPLIRRHAAMLPTAPHPIQHNSA